MAERTTAAAVSQLLVEEWASEISPEIQVAKVMPVDIDTMERFNIKLARAAWIRERHSQDGVEFLMLTNHVVPSIDTTCLFVLVDTKKLKILQSWTLIIGDLFRKGTQ